MSLVLSLALVTAPSGPAGGDGPVPSASSPAQPTGASTGSPAPVPSASSTTQPGADPPVPSASSPAPPTGGASPGSPAPVPSASLATAAPPDAMRVRLGVDIPVIGLGFAVGLGTELLSKELRWDGCGACDPQNINPLDRTVIGKHDHAAGIVSQVGVISAIGLPFVLDLGDALIQRARDRSGARARHMRAWGKDVVVLLETFAVTYSLTNVVKFAVRRPRPYSYDPDTTVDDPTENDARLSFYSGHAAFSFAMATAYASVFQARHPRSRWVAPVWVIGMSVASVTAIARVEAGKHFWTDVIVGALAGSAIGLAIPVLHRTTPLGGPRLALQIAPSRTGSLLVAHGRF